MKTNATMRTAGWLALLCGWGLPAPAPGRTWTSADGRTKFEATFIQYNAPHVKLVRPGGAELVVEETALSRADRDYCVLAERVAKASFGNVSYRIDRELVPGFLCRDLSGSPPPGREEFVSWGPYAKKTGAGDTRQTSLFWAGAYVCRSADGKERTVQSFATDLDTAVGMLAQHPVFPAFEPGMTVTPEGVAPGAVATAPPAPVAPAPGTSPPSTPAPGPATPVPAAPEPVKPEEKPAAVPTCAALKPAAGAPKPEPGDPQPNPDFHFAMTEWSKREAVRRYPQLAVTGSGMERAYMSLYDYYQKYRRSYFEDARWPLILAGEVARQVPPSLR